MSPSWYDMVPSVDGLAGAAGSSGAATVSQSCAEVVPGNEWPSTLRRRAGKPAAGHRVRLARREVFVRYQAIPPQNRQGARYHHRADATRSRR